MTTRAQLYDTDFYGWTQEQADKLRTGNLAGLDLDNLIEEIESMGRGERRELESRIELLLMHLLKWQYQPARRGKSWRLTIEDQRDRILGHVSENPSLKSKLAPCMQDAYRHARRAALRETQIDESAFPAQCPWTFDQATDADFWPET